MARAPKKKFKLKSRKSTQKTLNRIYENNEVIKKIKKSLQKNLFFKKPFVYLLIFINNETKQYTYDFD